MRSHPEDRMESRLLVAVDGLVAWGEVLIFKQLTAIWVGQKYSLGVGVQRYKYKYRGDKYHIQI